MATLVSFHAHPDDESIATGGVMANAADESHRVVLVVATRGEHGGGADGFLDPSEALWERRVKETQACADLLGAGRVEFLETSFFLAMPQEVFEGGFGQEWFVYCDAPAGTVEDDLFADLD